MNRPPSSRSCVVARGHVAGAHAADGVLAEDLLHHGAVADADLRVREGGLAVGGLRGERVAAVQDDDLADGVGQRERLLQGGVAAAHDADRAVAHERRVAARAVADAAALQALLALDAEGPQAGAGGEDHGPRLHLAVARLQAPAPRPRARGPRGRPCGSRRRRRRPAPGASGTARSRRRPRGSPGRRRCARCSAAARRAHGRRPRGSSGPCGPSGPRRSGRRCRHRRWLRRSCQPPRLRG